MRKLFLLFVFSIIAFLSQAQSYPFQWAKSMGDVDEDYGISIAVDGLGNSYSTGSFKGTVDFDPGVGVYNLVSAGNRDIFICKLDVNGNFVWVKQMGGISSDNAFSIALDLAGNIYTTGYFWDIGDFDPGLGVYNLTPLGSNDIFISKLDPLGNFVWAKQFGGTDQDIGYSIAIDGLGNVYSTGYFNNIADFDPGPGLFYLNAGGIYDDVFISKLDASGNFVWAKQFEGFGIRDANSIAVDAVGNVFTTGRFTSTTDFDPSGAVYNLIPNLNDVFVCKLDVAGNFIWAKQLGGPGIDVGSDVNFDAAGNIYTTGTFYDVADFDPGVGVYNLTSFAGSNDIFISKLDPMGNFVWAKQLGGSDYDCGIALVIDGTGNVYSTGMFSDISDFDPGAGTYNLTSLGYKDAFISKLDASGNFVMAAQIGGIYVDSGQDIVLDAPGNIYTTGYFSDIVDFDPGAGVYNLAAAGVYDIFIHKMGSCISPIAPTNTSNIINQNICNGNSTTLSAIGSGTINWYATPLSTISLGSGTNFITPTLTVGTYTYYANDSTCTYSSLRTPITITVNACLGINQINLTEITNLKIYPNPGVGIFTLKTKVDGFYEVKVFNLFGALVQSISFKGTEKDVNIENLSQGVYTFVIKQNNAISKSIKVIKE